MDISKIDRNFQVDSEIDKSGFDFYSIDEKPMRLYGVFREGENYTRVPTDVAKRVSDGVASLIYCTAGGRVRFVTDAKRIALIARFSSEDHSPHMPFSNQAGIDIYEGKKYSGTFMPPVRMPNCAFESARELFEDGEKVITLNLPNYGRPCEVYVGIEKGATLKEAPDHTYECPVVYYGSSITQGGCASRPGMAYQGILSRRFDANFINLGFSGNARGEKTIVDYMASLDMSVFVCDYDHNAPNPEHLLATHEPLYRGIRAAHPETPIIFITRPSVMYRENRDRRRDIIKATYDKAVAEGDKNVWFLDASEFFDFDSNEHTVDLCHPTDLGFYLMAKGIEPTLAEALERVKI